MNTEYAAILKPPTLDELAEAFCNSWTDPQTREYARIALQLVIDAVILETKTAISGRAAA